MRFALLILWVALTGWFLFSPTQLPLDGTVNERQKVSAADIEPGAARASLMDPPRVHIGGVDQKCSDCHSLFKSLDVTPGVIRQHGHIEMRHGLNGRCFNCHQKDDRNVLVLNDGSTVGFSDSTSLCANCHGTVFRDWERGMHGKTLGSWDKASGKQYHLRCVDCHNPHSPAFGKIPPLPGPNTLRMGTPRKHDGKAQARNPLERWKSALHGDHAVDDHEESEKH